MYSYNTHTYTHTHTGFITQILLSTKEVKFSCPLYCRAGKHGIPSKLQDQACNIQLKSNM